MEALQKLPAQLNLQDFFALTAWPYLSFTPVVQYLLSLGSHDVQLLHLWF